MNDPLIWSILLLLVGVALIALELFIPSGGILGMLAAAALLSAIVVAFLDKRPLSGPAVLALVAVGVPILIYAAVQWWPNSPLGRLILIQNRRERAASARSRTEQLKAMIGRRGAAESKMLPGGVICVDGQSYDAVSEGAGVDAGSPIRVVAVRNNRLVVRSDEGEPPPSQPEEKPDAADDILSQPLDALGLEDLDEPLG